MMIGIHLTAAVDHTYSIEAGELVNPAEPSHGLHGLDTSDEPKSGGKRMLITATIARSRHHGQLSDATDSPPLTFTPTAFKSERKKKKPDHLWGINLHLRRPIANHNLETIDK